MKLLEGYLKCRIKAGVLLACGFFHKRKHKYKLYKCKRYWYVKNEICDCKSDNSK